MKPYWFIPVNNTGNYIGSKIEIMADNIREAKTKLAYIVLDIRDWDLYNAELPNKSFQPNLWPYAPP